MPYEAPKERSMVEAMGVEPMSALLPISSATCLVSDYTSATPLRQSLLHPEAVVILHRATILHNLTRESHLDNYELIRLIGTSF